MWYPRNGLKREPSAQKRLMLCLQQECSGEVGRQMDCPYTTVVCPSLRSFKWAAQLCGAGMLGIVIFFPVTMEVWTFWERIFSWLLQHGQRRRENKIAVALFIKEGLVQLLSQCLGVLSAYHSLMSPSKWAIIFLGNIGLDLCSFLPHMTPYSS